MPKQKKIAVLYLDNSTRWQPLSIGDLFLPRLGKPCNSGCCTGPCCQCCGETWHVYNIAAGEELPVDLDDHQAVVLTGSRFNCRERATLDWFEPICEFVRRAEQVGKPRIFGGCFGCQLIAHALGGDVDYNPNNNFVLKAETIRVNVEMFSHFVETLWKESLCILESHGDCVRKLPPQSELLGSSDSCENEIYVTGRSKNILACQSHPEFEFKYCIQDRIWPSVVDTKERLTPEEIEDAMASFQNFTSEDSILFLQAVGKFLRA